MINFSQLNSTYQLMNNSDSMNKYQNEDYLDRMMKHLKNITNQNDKLQKQKQLLQSNPEHYINPIKNKMMAKIQLLQSENQKIKKMIQKNNMPIYSQIKRASIVPGENHKIPNHINNINNKNNYNSNNLNQPRDSLRSSLNQSLRNSTTMRSALSQIRSSYNNSNFDKNQSASTCFNQQQKYLIQQSINPIIKLQPLSLNEQEQRRMLTEQIRYLIAKTQIFQETMQKLQKKQKNQVQHTNISLTQAQNQPAIHKIQQYKNKLLRLLNKLKSRQIQMEQMVKVYKKLHEQTIKKLQQSTLTLKQLQQKQIDQDVQKKYQQVLELEEKLQIINSQLQEMDEEKWLNKVMKQLSIVCKRLGVALPKCQSVRGTIDQLCESLIQGHLMTRDDVGMRLNQLKQYHEEEHQNNQRLVQALKIKQQGLGKKLTMLQIQKEQGIKK